MGFRKFKRIKTHNKFTKKSITKSKAEVEFSLFLLSLGIITEDQFRLGYKYYDFIIKGTNILIEFDGDYFHANPTIYKDPNKLNKMQKKNRLNDNFKNSLALANGYKLFRFWESDFRKNKKLIIDTLKGIT